MKLNPPETAPKDRRILAHFEDVNVLMSAIWYREHEHWCGLGRFVALWFKPSELLGWLPMPQIDDQGNVT